MLQDAGHLVREMRTINASTFCGMRGCQVLCNGWRKGREKKNEERGTSSSNVVQSSSGGHMQGRIPTRGVDLGGGSVCTAGRSQMSVSSVILASGNTVESTSTRTSYSSYQIAGSYLNLLTESNDTAGLPGRKERHL